MWGGGTRDLGGTHELRNKFNIEVYYLLCLALSGTSDKHAFGTNSHLKKSVQVARGPLVVEAHETAVRAAKRLVFPLRRT